MTRIGGGVSNGPEVEAAERRKSRYRDITGGVFGLVLALGAFSLTNQPIRTPGDVWTALGLFTPAFFFVLAIWQLTGDLMDRYPPEDNVFYAAVTLILFLTTLAPVFLNLLLDDAPPVQRLGALLFPLSMAAVFALIAVLWLRLTVVVGAQDEIDNELRPAAAQSATVALIFLVSLIVPFTASGSPARSIVWMTAFVLPQFVARLVRSRHR